MAFTMTSETRKALQRLDSGDNILLTGKAGTGKSTLLRKFLETQPAGETLVLAPTGVAALNVKGATIHRAFGFRPGLYPDDVRNFANYHPSAATKKVLQTVRTIIIDEISMVRADLFDMMNLALSQIRKVGRPFGGVRLILVGDLLQLPPVVTDNEREEFLDRWSTPYFFSAHCYPSLELCQINLQTIWRQSDEEFVEILNQVREGQVSDEALAVLNSRVSATPRADEGFLTLTSRRRRVSQINHEKLRELGTEILSSTARYEGITDESTFPGEPELEYAAGARVMTVINDPQKRFVNGSMGTIVVAEAERITVRLDQGPEVTLEPHTWEFRRPVVDDGSLSSQVTGTVTQFPLILSWAITIHKSQGKTIPKCVIDLSGGTTTDGQFYVALSRAVSLENLYFTRSVRRENILADASLVRRILRDSSPTRVPDRVLFLSSDHVDFGISQHIARIHATVVESGSVVSDFGTWINPMADLGTLGTKYSIPAGGMAACPTIEEFWPLLLRQASGALVIGDGLATIERAVRHQSRGLKVNLGIGYDTHDFNFEPVGNDPVARCASMRQAYQEGLIDPQQGTDVPEASRNPGALFVPSWATTEIPRLDQFRALPEDLAWAALSGAKAVEVREELLHDAANELAETALERGGWRKELRAELIDRVQQAGGSVPALPEVIDQAAEIGEFLVPGARVVFTGGGVILGETRSDEELVEICAARGMEFKTSMSRSRCDVLIADDISTMSNKAKRARDYGKPIFSTGDFNSWYRQQPTTAPASVISDSEPAVSVIAPDTLEPVVTNQTPVSSESASTVPSVPAAEVLRRGSRVAVSGAVHIDGRHYTRGGELEQLLEDVELEYKTSVSRTRCDALIADPAAPVSGQLRSAVEFDKPVITHADFASWAVRKLAGTATPDPAAPESVEDDSPKISVASEEPSTPRSIEAPVEPGTHASGTPTVDHIFTSILAGHDFRGFRNRHLTGITHGKRAEAFSSTEQLHQAILRDSPELSQPPSRVMESLKRSGIILGVGVAAVIVFALLDDGPPDGIWITLSAISLLAVMIGLPVAALRAAYLALKSRREKPAHLAAAMHRELGGPPEQQLPVVITGDGPMAPMEQELLEQLCGFHDHLVALGYPIPAQSWRELVYESVMALRSHQHTGNRDEALLVGQQISNWMAAARSAHQAQ